MLTDFSILSSLWDPCILACCLLAGTHIILWKSKFTWKPDCNEKKLLEQYNVGLFLHACLIFCTYFTLGGVWMSVGQVCGCILLTRVLQ
jgi:hypothetical protein